MVPLIACHPQVEMMSKCCQAQPGNAMEFPGPVLTSPKWLVRTGSMPISRLLSPEPLWAAPASGRATGPELSRELFRNTGARIQKSTTPRRWDHRSCSIARDQTDVLTHIDGTLWARKVDA